MALYGGLDLHGDNVYCALLDERRRTVFAKRLPNDLPTILAALEPYRERLRSLAVEATYNWYWLVDGLRAQGYPTLLANPARMQENLGLKHADDRSDAEFLARQQAMGVLPEGYVYPREVRPVRDLLRRRMKLVQARTGEWLSLQSRVARQSGREVELGELREMEAGALEALLGDDPLVRMAAQTSFRHIAFLDREIAQIERTVLERVKDTTAYERLTSVPGIGRILAMTIALETGPIQRFPGPGHYASYCRAAKTEHLSNGRRKGAGNAKSGNRYLAWAYVEAANFAVRHCPELRRWYQRKAARTSRVVAIKAVANKLAKACFFLLRDGAEFDVKRLVG